MLMLPETAREPRLWFAWRPVYARSASGRRAGWVWLEQVVAEYIEGSYNGWHYRRIPKLSAWYENVSRPGSPPAHCDNAGCEHRYAYEQRGDHPGPLAG